MTSPDGDEDAFKAALAHLQVVQAKFCRKINDLKALRHSIKDAVAQEDSTEEEYNEVKEELAILVELRQEYEASVNEFNAKSGWKKNQDQVVEVNRVVDGNLDAARNVKVSLEMLLRKIRKQLAFSEETNTDINSEEESESESDNELDEANNGKTMSKKWMIVFGLITVIVFYGGLGYIIKTVQDNRRNSGKDWSTTKRSNIQNDSSTCGQDSFMLRDGVCDETANTAECLFDGGDCCIGFKDVELCRDCTCRLGVDKSELEKQFQALEIKPLADTEDNILTNPNFDAWRKIEVEMVVSPEVCATLCLDDRNTDNLNAWLYQNQTCTCGWVESQFCSDTMVISNWTWKNATSLQEHTAFVQLNKTVACGKSTLFCHTYHRMSLLFFLKFVHRLLGSQIFNHSEDKHRIQSRFWRCHSNEAEFTALSSVVPPLR